MLAAIILSGGSSSRMGSPKALLEYHGQPFLEHLLDVTKNSRIGVRRVVLGAHAEPIRKVVSLNPDEVVINEDWQKGQLSSIQAALQSLPAATDGALICPVDHPLISRSLVVGLVAQFYETKALVVLPVFEGRRGHPVIFAAALYGELQRASVDLGARSVVWTHKNEVSEYITGEEGCVVNLNDPDTFARLTRSGS
jgi:molybdenum cofactor cytidylyltransferase